MYATSSLGPSKPISRVWRDLVGHVPPHFPMQADWDTDALFCGAAEISFDNHLQGIAVPILYVGAAGGFGTYGYYTTTLTASTEVGQGGLPCKSPPNLRAVAKKANDSNGEPDVRRITSQFPRGEL